jgi:hypothetical protein
VARHPSKRPCRLGGEAFRELPVSWKQSKTRKVSANPEAKRLQHGTCYFYLADMRDCEPSYQALFRHTEIAIALG